MPALLNSKAPASISSTPKSRTLKMMTIESRKPWLEFLRSVASESHRAYFNASASFENIWKMQPTTPASGYQPPIFIDNVLRMAAKSHDHTGGDYIPYLTVIYHALVDLLETPLEGNAHLPLEFDDATEDPDDHGINIIIINEKGDIHCRSKYAPTDLLGLRDPYAVKTEPIMQHLLRRLFGIIHLRLTERATSSKGTARTRKDFLIEAKKDYPAFVKVFNEAIACLEGDADAENED